MVKRVSDPQVLAFWTKEFPKINHQTDADGVARIANKLGAFLANPLVRKAICDLEEPLRFRRIMVPGARS